MLDGVNDRPEHARQLVALLRGRPAKVNLIPFNPFPGTHYRCSTRRSDRALPRPAAEGRRDRDDPPHARRRHRRGLRPARRAASTTRSRPRARRPSWIPDSRGAGMNRLVVALACAAGLLARVGALVRRSPARPTRQSLRTGRGDQHAARHRVHAPGQPLRGARQHRQGAEAEPAHGRDADGGGHASTTGSASTRSRWPISTRPPSWRRTVRTCSTTSRCTSVAAATASAARSTS